MPDEPEAAGLLALMLLSESRRPARIAEGDFVLLRDQDRSSWDRSLIDEGQAIVRACIRRGRPGPFQIQAAIQAVHSHAETFEATDWPQIVALYDHLFSLMPTPVVALNRAIAIGEIEGPAAALAALDAVAPDLDNYHLLHAARGTALSSARTARRSQSRIRTSSEPRDDRVGPAVPRGADRRVDRRPVCAAATQLINVSRKEAIVPRRLPATGRRSAHEAAPRAEAVLRVIAALGGDEPVVVRAVGGAGRPGLDDILEVQV